MEFPQKCFSKAQKMRKIEKFFIKGMDFSLKILYNIKSIGCVGLLVRAWQIKRRTPGKKGVCQNFS